MIQSLFVVCGLVTHNGKILVLKKSEDDYNYPERWSFVGGFVKEFEPGEDTIIREIEEETGLQARIVQKGPVVVGKDEKKEIDWVTLPFICEADTDKVKLDHENTAYCWITKEEVKNYPFVPGIIESLKSIGFL
ncbi:MAG: NUDIX hydrolase [Nanoarchaeota archaeon]|nr:NUDIX hydrolase [Nanoarchaeota archaeon]